MSPYEITLLSSSTKLQCSNMSFIEDVDTGYDISSPIVLWLLAKNLELLPRNICCFFADWYPWKPYDPCDSKSFVI